MPGMVNDQQWARGLKDLTTEQIAVRDKHREEVVSWMDYLISNETTSPTPNEIMDMPVEPVQ
jgi:hypothetical protein